MSRKAIRDRGVHVDFSAALRKMEQQADESGFSHRAGPGKAED
jgi:hypothetical protein